MGIGDTVEKTFFAQCYEQSKKYVEQVRVRGTVVGENTILWGKVDQAFPKLITIGRNCLLATESMLLTHGPVATPKGGGAVTIGDNVYICFRAIILPGVTIGDNCIIGAGAVVPRDIPSDSIAVGNPAQVVKQRDPETLKWFIEAMEKWGAKYGSE